jgi:hypothetical protein
MKIRRELNTDEGNLINSFLRQKNLKHFTEPCSALQEMLVTKGIFLDELYPRFMFLAGARGRVVVKALCYKPEGLGFDT